ncbi:MAG: NosD domain-containing protein, partial [Methanobacteriaceae archaeon]|nr:NosD domain-containing protein [Methanobacteriaceae archaeon]
ITGSVYGINPQYSTMDIHFNRISGSSSFGIVNQANSTINATNNWWGTSTPSYLNSPTWPSYRDIWNANGTLYYSPYFTSDIGFTSDQIINASIYVKNYVESNHQLPSSVNISGIMVNMPQFLKLAVESVVNADSGLDDLIVLGDYGTVPSHVENMTDYDVLDLEYLSIADEILDYMDLNRIAPSNISNTSLGDSMSFESLVYMYSKVLVSYGANNKTLPDSISINPWIAVSNPNKIYNFRTQELFNNIQSAIDDMDTIANDTISLWKGNYLENVIINKTVIIESLEGNVTVSALNTSLPVFTINTLGNGSIIQNLRINGSLNSGVFINNSFNNIIFNNVINSNGNGIRIYNSTDNEISSNLISNNTLNGIFVYLGGNNTFSGNNLTYNGNGIMMNNSLNNTICINLVSKNLLDGISIVNSSADVSFNLISQNGRYGLHNQDNSTVDAQNNWWGSNNPSVSATGPSDIYNSSGTLNCDKWIVMNVNSTCDRSNRTGACYNYAITADLTHNNQGNDTSGDGNIPDGIPVNFNTTVGTISTGYTRNGKAVSNLNSSAAGLANVSVTLNNQTNNITVNVTSINVMGIYNNRTHEGFTTIQNAINDNDTLNGDIITLNDGIYTENVVVNKTLVIRPLNGSLVTITGSDPNLAIFNITNSGSGSSINGLSIIGSEDSYGVFLNATTNCNITGNVITDNDVGIYLYLSNNNTIQGNSLIDNNYGLGLYNSTNNVLSGNYLTGNDYGIYLKDSNYNVIIRNNATDNWEAINLVTSNNNSILNNTINDSWIGNYLYLSNNTMISGNNFEENGVGICYYDSNNTSFSGNNFAENWIKDVSEIDSKNIVLATTIYTCGPAALATVMMHMGLNATEEDLANWADTDDTGTSMYGLVQAANKTGLTAYGFRLSIDQLKTDYIVVLNINDNNHFAIIQNITNTTVYLIDPNLGNIEMNLTAFNNTYTGYALVINNITEINGTLLDNDTMKTIKGTDLFGAIINAAKKSPLGKVANKVYKYVKSTPIGKKAVKLYHAGKKAGKALKKYVYKGAKEIYHKYVPSKTRKEFKKLAKTITSTFKNPIRPIKPIKITYDINKDKLGWCLVNEISFIGGVAAAGIKGAILLEGANRGVNTVLRSESLIPSMEYLKTPWLTVNVNGKVVLVKRFTGMEIWNSYGQYGNIMNPLGFFAYK